MKRLMKKYNQFILLLILFNLISFCYAKNIGTVGQIYSIDEMDFLDFIKEKTLLVEKNGGVTHLQQTMKKRANEYRDRPAPVENVTHADKSESWLFDPSIVLDHDVFSANGKLIARKGTQVNPLKFVHLNKTLIFYDADDVKETAWVAQFDKKVQGNDKLTLVKGSLLQEEKRFSKAIYFDQAGRLTARFNIKHVPAVVSEEGNLLRISEVKP